MAGKGINFDISANDNGTIDKLLSKTKQVNKEFEKIKATASNINTGTKSGEKAMRAPTELEEYTTAGGVGRRRGAGARDFAAEAQGLGGLVRLYAEYAANIYAVTAAFTALQNAMQTEVMIRGMQQLGAQSGTSLVGLTKQFVSATDGMVSFREAAEAVTKVTTSGMGKQQIMDIATVAKGASQALGLSMTDAVSRLSRGITKLEPELLDELGLFTKLDKAVSDYARSVGKTEGQLTDFERRQAFANAVLAEGKQKFSEIAQEGNPYDQLLASLKNVATDILNVVNTVVAPIAKILANSTELLTAAIGLFALKLVSKVFPVISDYRDKLDKLAQESKDKAQKIAKAAEERQVFGRTGLEQKAGVPEAKKELDIAKAQVELLRDQRATAVTRHESAKKILDIENQITAAIANQTLAKKKLETAQDRATQLGESLTTFSPTAYIQGKNAQEASRKAARTSIVADVSRGFETKGIRESFAELGSQVTASKELLGTWGSTTTRVAGAFAILAQGIAQVGSFIFNKLLAPLSLIIAAYQLLSSIFSENGKEMQKLSDSLDELSDSTKTAIETNEKYKNSLSIEGVLAYANSIRGLDENIQKLVKNFDSTKKAEGWFDTLTNFLADLTPGWDSIEEKTSAGLGASIAAGIENIKSEPLKAELTKKYKDILKIDDNTPLTPKTIESALNKLDGFGAEAANRYKQALIDLGVVSEGANKKVQEQSLYLRGLKDSGDLATKSIQNFMNSLKDSSPFSQMLQNNIKSLTELRKGLNVDDLASQAAAMDAISKVDFAIFGSAAIDIARMSDEFQAQKINIEDVNAALEEQKKKLKELQVAPIAESSNKYYKRMAEISQVKEVISIQERVIKEFENKFIAMRNRVVAAISQSVKEMAEKAVEAHQLELAKIKIDYSKAILGMMPVKTESTLKLQADLDKKSIDIESRLINSQMQLANSIDKLRLTIELDRDRDRIKILEEKKQKGASLSQPETDELNRLNRRLESSKRAMELIDTGTMEDIQAMIGQFPELFDALQRRMKQLQSQQKAASDRAKVDVKLSVDTIKLKSDEAQAAIAFEIEKTSQIISQIGSDTPEKLDAQINFANAALKSQNELIDSKTKELIDIINKLASTGELSKTAAADALKKVKTEDERAKTLVRLKTEQENFNRLTDRNVLSVKQTNDLLIQRLELQKQLIRGESLEAFDELDKKNKEILRLQQQIELSNAEAAAEKSKRALEDFNTNRLSGYKQFTEFEHLLSPELKGQRESLRAAAAGDDSRVNKLKNLQAIQKSVAEEQSKYERTTREIAITEATLRSESEAELRIEERLSANKEHQLKLDENIFGIQTSLAALHQRDISILRIENQLYIDKKRLAEEILIAERALTEEKRRAGTTTFFDQVTGESFQVQTQTEGTIKAQATVNTLKAREKDLPLISKQQKDLINQTFTPQFDKSSEAGLQGYIKFLENIESKNPFKNLIIDTEKHNSQIDLGIVRLKNTNDLTIKRIELEKQLIRGESIEAFDQLTKKNKDILSLQQELERREAEANLNKSINIISQLEVKLKQKPDDEGLARELDVAKDVRKEFQRKLTDTKQLHDLTNDMTNKVTEQERTLRRMAITEAELVAKGQSKLRAAEELAAIREHELKLEEIKLDKQAQLGTKIGDELKINRMNIQFGKIDEQLKRDQTRLTEEIAIAKRALEEEEYKAGTTKTFIEVNKVFEEDITQNVTEGTIRAKDRLDNLNTSYKNLGITAARAKEEIKQAFVSDDVLAFTQVWQQSFQKMGDALLQFATTGKGTFKDLMSAIGQDFARTMMKMAMDKLAANSLNFILTAMGFGSGATFKASYQPAAIMGLPGYAKGDMFNVAGYAKGATFNAPYQPVTIIDAPEYGKGSMFNVAGYAKGSMFNVEGYARGNSFTNKIVDSPTLFKFEDGGTKLGVMGEAGPEAIMPLRKDKEGNLGVIAYASGEIMPIGRTINGDLGVNVGQTRASTQQNPQYNHETIIYNYSGQPISERQSLDSRGTRRTEYFIGEAAALETARTGGSVQNAIRNTYGIQPRLVRR